MTPAEAHAALDDILETAGIRVSDPGAGDPPYAFAFGNGADLTHALRGAAEWSWRVTAVAGLWDTRAAADALDALTVAIVSAIRDDRTGWMYREVRPVTRLPLAGGTYLACDVIVAHAVDI